MSDPRAELEREQDSHKLTMLDLHACRRELKEAALFIAAAVCIGQDEPCLASWTPRAEAFLKKLGGLE